MRAGRVAHGGEGFEFTVTLDVLLDAVDRLRADGWESPRGR